MQINSPTSKLHRMSLLGVYGYIISNTHPIGVPMPPSPPSNNPRKVPMSLVFTPKNSSDETVNFTQDVTVGTNGFYNFYHRNFPSPDAYPHVTVYIPLGFRGATFVGDGTRVDIVIGNNN